MYITGITETTRVISYTTSDNIWYGSCGTLLPHIEARLVTLDGKNIDCHNKPGELWLRSPSIAIGYRNNAEETAKTFGKDGWMLTGDEALIKPSPQGNEHIFIVDRIKELIKVKVSNCTTHYASFFSPSILLRSAQENKTADKTVV